MTSKFSPSSGGVTVRQISVSIGAAKVATTCKIYAPLGILAGLSIWHLSFRERYSSRRCDQWPDNQPSWTCIQKRIEPVDLKNAQALGLLFNIHLNNVDECCSSEIAGKVVKGCVREYFGPVTYFWLMIAGWENTPDIRCRAPRTAFSTASHFQHILPTPNVLQASCTSTLYDILPSKNQGRDHTVLLRRRSTEAWNWALSSPLEHLPDNL